MATHESEPLTCELFENGTVVFGSRYTLLLMSSLLLAPCAAEARDFQVEFDRALEMARKNSTEAALKAFEKLAKEYPKQPEIWNNLAAVQAARGDLEAAAKSLQRSLQARSSSAIPSRNLETIYARQARLAYDSALGNTGKNPDPLRLSLLELDKPSSTDSAPRPKVDLSRELQQTRVSLDTTRARARRLEQQLRVAQKEQARTLDSLLQELHRRDIRLDSLSQQMEAHQARKPIVIDTTPARPIVAVAPVPKPKAPTPIDTVLAAKPVAKPMPTKPTVSAAPGFPGDSVRQVLLDWASAWSRQDVDAYLNFYSPRFVPPNGMERAAWEQQRRERISAPTSIEVTLRSLELCPIGNDSAEILFEQQYKNNATRMRSRKRVILVREDQVWRILTEGEAPK